MPPPQRVAPARGSGAMRRDTPSLAHGVAADTDVSVLKDKEVPWHDVK